MGFLAGPFGARILKSLALSYRPRTSTDDRSVLWRHDGFAVVKVVRPAEAAEARDRCPALLDGHEVAVLGPAEPFAVCCAPAIGIGFRVVVAAHHRCGGDQDGGNGEWSHDDTHGVLPQRAARLPVRRPRSSGVTTGLPSYK
jgi:hypothetical protein